MSASIFESTHGFPRASVSLANWRSAPWNVWAFRHVPELIPTARIASASTAPEGALADPSPLLRETLLFGDRRLGVAEVLRETFTDALVVMKSGRFVADFHAPHFTSKSRHILFSASKSVAGLLAGILVGEGRLDPARPVTDYVPELAASAFGDASVRHVLDMQTCLSFTEDYSDPNGSFARYRRAGMLDPPLAGEPPETVIGFLASLRKGEGEHGERFTYSSPNSDVLGLIVERASGQRYPDLLTEKLWEPLQARTDAAITVDAEGTARAGGGLSMSPRDLARIGEMVRCGGSVDGRRIVPEHWIRDTACGGDGALQGGTFASVLPDGRYRNQWYQVGDGTGSLFAVGIHGQWLYVNPAAEIVIAKFSSQPDASDDPVRRLNVALFRAIPALM
ncbi:serine hydrolase domain-containing protein [Bradyrhizobium tropiciagri]|uniref:serine hydrolase domain-containing protein n=1 Tax=Bradyrhizobium tropiciagri TaxID=312253 RepID=UPI0032DE35B7